MNFEQYIQKLSESKGQKKLKDCKIKKNDQIEQTINFYRSSLENENSINKKKKESNILDLFNFDNSKT